MGQLREFLKKNPVAGWAVVIVLVAAIGYLIAGRLFSGPAPQPAGPTRPASPPAATPVPTPVGPPQVARAQPSPSSVVPTGPTGRADPFLPLVRQQIAGPPPPPPPGPPLPPPPFPVPTAPLPPPPSPGPAAQPPGPPSAAGITVTGIVGDTGAVAIIVIDGKTQIVSSGETVGDLRVLRIDPVRRVVTFSRAGKRFDVRMGGE